MGVWNSTFPSFSLSANLWANQVAAIRVCNRLLHTLVSQFFTLELVVAHHSSTVFNAKVFTFYVILALYEVGVNLLSISLILEYNSKGGIVTLKPITANDFYNDKKSGSDENTCNDKSSLDDKRSRAAI